MAKQGKENFTQLCKPVEEAVGRAVEAGVICGASLGFIGPAGSRFCYLGRQGVVPPYCRLPIRKGLYYDLASLSKVIGTTTRILMMLEGKQLSLNSRISDLLPRFRYPEITVEHLLLHDSGLPAEIMEKENWSRETILALLYGTKPEGRPGERFIYSDVGFILLGKVIEALDAVTLEESFQKHIFVPLNMQHTSYLTGEDKLSYVPTECTGERGCICGEVHDRKAHLMGPCGSAGLFSTLEDVIRFAGLCLEQSEQLFSKETFGLLWRKEKFGRTLGWSLEYGTGTLYHTGFTGTSILMDLKQGIGMVLLTNRIHPTRENEEFLIRRRKWNQMFLKR